MNQNKKQTKKKEFAAKKLRQLYRREYAGAASEHANIMRHMGKPKPSWMPKFIWRLCVDLVLRTPQELAEILEKRNGK